MEGPEPYAGSERREGGGGRQRFDAAVEEGARRAAEQIARIHRFRLVRDTFLVTLIVSLSIAAVAITLTQHANRAFSKRVAVYDCTIFTRVSKTLGDFVQSDANLRARQDALGIGMKTANLIPGDSSLRRTAKRSTALSAAAVLAWDQDAGTLDAIAETDCPVALAR